MPEHSAAGSVAGFEWQKQLALRELFGLPEGGFVEIETLDDVAIFQDPTSFSTAQAKHSFVSGSLTDETPEFWKTLRVWIHHVKSAGDRAAQILRLCSTGKIPPQSQLTTLAAPPAARTQPHLRTLASRLDEIADAQGNKALKQCYGAWKSADSDTRERVLTRAVIEDGERGLTTSRATLRSLLRVKGFDTESLDVGARLVSGWFSETVNDRLSLQGCRIHVSELLDTIGQVRRVLPPLALASTYGDATYGDLSGHQANLPNYLKQLALLKANQHMRDVATLMFLRATDERKTWTDNIPIARVVLKDYDACLTNRWEMARAQALIQALANSDEAIAAGWKVHNSCMDYFGTLCTSPAQPHVAYGSYHILANKRRIGWHPEWESRLDDSAGGLPNAE